MKHFYDFKIYCFVFCALFIVIPGFMQAQDNSGQEKVQITGKVVSASDQLGIPAVNIVEKGTMNGVISDIDGSYAITVSKPDAILVFSYVGFTKQEISVAGKTILDVTLEEDFLNLDEVVVIGYGSTRKKDLTGSVGSVKAEVFESRPITSFEEGIQGNVAGVQVTSAGGQPGAEMKVKIRGVTSINSNNDPLIVVDGFPLSASNSNMGGLAPSGGTISTFGTINPNDIESIEFLKDASATAIYGSRGANGVILITTKKGRIGKPVINYSSYFGAKEITNKYDLLTIQEFAELNHVVRPQNRLYTQRDADRTPINYDPVNSVDWQDEIFRRGFIQNHSVSMQGGNDMTKYLLSFSYLDEKATIIGNRFKKYNFKLSLEQKFNENVKIGTDVSYGYIMNDGVLTEGGFDSGAGLLTYALQSAPIDYSDPETWQYLTGVIDEQGIEDLQNAPYTFVTAKSFAEESQNDTKNGRLIGNAFLEYSFLEDFKLRITGGVDINNIKNYKWFPKSSPHGAFYDSYAVLGHILGTSWLNENILTYTKNWTRGTSLNLTGGFTQQYYRQEMFRVEVNQFENETLGLNAIQNGLGIPNRPYSRLDENTLRSFLGRATYNLLDRYLITASFRADGSSRFTEGNRWGFFPSAAVAWRLSNENFMDGADWVDDLKFRVSYGSIGNEAVNSNAAYATLINTQYVSEGSIIPGVSPFNMLNENLSWETTNSFNTGIDFTVLNYRVNLTMDYYNKSTVDVLLQAPISSMSGFTSVWQNIGKVRNEGFEFTMNSQIVKQDAFSWDFSFNFSKNTNEVLELTNDNAPIPIAANYDGSYPDDYLIEVGQPLGNMYGYVWDGVYQEDDFSEINYEDEIFVLKDGVPYRFGNERPGDIKFKNFDDDLQVNEADRKVIGNGLPDMFGGFNTNLRYKNIELFAGFNWSVGNDIYNANLKRLTNLTGQQNQIANSWNERWTPENQNNEYYSRYLDQKPSSYWIEDGSYLRFQTLRLSYTFPKEMMNAVKIAELKVYLTVDNVFVWTDYSGYDPEVSTSQGASGLAFGLDYGAYPRSRSVMLGLNVNF
jgi:TonB-linked SusC/RagA family outer membrane protein